MQHAVTTAPRLDRFVEAMTSLADRQGLDEATTVESARSLLADLIAVDDWLPDALATPHPTYYQQYLLHADPQGRFSLVSFVWGPGQSTPIHDHTVWGLIGMLRGGERGERYEIDQPGQAPRMVGQGELHPGDIEHVSPTVGDIHRVSNLHDDRVSISIHLYGGDIGKVSRHVFDPATGAVKNFISGYSLPAPTVPSDLH